MNATFVSHEFRQRRHLGIVVCIATMTAALVAGPAWGAVFQIDPQQSTLHMAAVVDVGTGPTPTEPQAFVGTFDPTYPGSAYDAGFSLGDIARYAGTINATVTGSAIQFNSGNIDAIPTGIYGPDSTGGSPIGSVADLSVEEADYGFWLAVVYSALRDFRLNINSGPLSLTGTDFDVNGVGLPVLSGELSYTDTVGGALVEPGFSSLAGAPLTNISSDPGTLVGSGIGSVLTIPVEISQVILIGDVPADLVVTGTLVAIQVPEPSTVALMGIGLVGLVVGAYRQRRNRR